ncbi:hypothetical protein Nmel_005768, partial [Mimus melanotis]
ISALPRLYRRPEAAGRRNQGGPGEGFPGERRPRPRSRRGAGHWCPPGRTRSPGGPRAPLRAPGEGNGAGGRGSPPSPGGLGWAPGPGRPPGTPHPASARPALPPLRDAPPLAGAVAGCRLRSCSAPERHQLRTEGSVPSPASRAGGCRSWQPPRAAGQPGRLRTLRPTCDPPADPRLRDEKNEETCGPRGQEDVPLSASFLGHETFIQQLYSSAL